MFNYSELRGKIRAKYHLQSSFAAAMGMSTTTLSARLNNHSDWSQAEISAAIKLLGIPETDIPLYFFTRPAQELEQNASA
ncbi:MAG: DUF739 family protein [Clostridia bacterium]|nr:DUF739 family protein [Clostridia bacterium]